jgi:hypothetical protein
MTITNETIKTETAGNGLTTKYYFTFTIYADVDLLVVVTNNTTGVATTLTLNSDYSVSIAGKYITLVAGTLVPSGSTISISSDLPYTQEFDQAEGDDFPVASIITVLDKLTILALQNNTLINELEPASVADAKLAKIAAEYAQSHAEAAQTGAISAKNSADADVVLTHADVVTTGLNKIAAEHAQADAEAAQHAAETAQGLAEDAQSHAEAAQTGAETAQGLAEHAQADAEVAQGEAEDNATIAQNTAAGITSMYSSVIEGQAVVNALLGLGIGGSYINSEGELIMTYNTASVTSVEINDDGELIVEY